MSKFKISIRERRFLIIWILFFSLALICNIAQIKGSYDSSVYKDGKQYGTGGYVLTSTSMDDASEVFWPFTSKFLEKRTLWEIRNGLYYSPTYDSPEVNEFKGIFNGFDYLEFLVYIVLGFLIVFIPKIW